MLDHIKAVKGVKKNTEYGLLIFGSILMGLSIAIFVIYGLLHIAIECKSKLMIGTFISIVLSAGKWNRPSRILRSRWSGPGSGLQPITKVNPLSGMLGVLVTFFINRETNKIFVDGHKTYSGPGGGISKENLQIKAFI